MVAAAPTSLAIQPGRHCYLCRWSIQQPHARWSAFAIVYVCFSRIKKLLGRTETRTRDRMYCQTIGTVRDISRDDRARIATCSLRTPTDRLKENYSIDDRWVITRQSHRISSDKPQTCNVTVADPTAAVRESSVSALLCCPRPLSLKDTALRGSGKSPMRLLCLSSYNS